MLVSVVVAVVLLTMGGAATVMAQQESTLTPEATTKGLLATRVASQIEFGKSFGYVGANMTAGLLARVAEILGIPQEDLAGAFEQAQQEIREEAFFKFLDKAVEDGSLTEEEADEIKGWWRSKPEFLDQGQLRHLFGSLMPRGRRMTGVSDNVAGEGMRGQANGVGQWWGRRPGIQNQGVPPHAFGLRKAPSEMIEMSFISPSNKNIARERIMQNRNRMKEL